MNLTADALTRVLAVCCGSEPEGPEEAVLMLRQEQPSFAPTIYSAWRNEGMALNPALSYELEVHLERMQRYRSLAADLARIPGLVPLKGLEIADHYPHGLARYMNDLDYAVADEPRLWRLVDELVVDGWDLHTATFSIFDGRLHMLVCLRMPHADRYSLPYGVEITSYVTMGDLAGVAPVIELPPRWRDPVVKNLLMLLFERFEQPYRARDLVDAALLLSALTDHQVLWQEIDRLGLWPEYAELTSLLARTELVELPVHRRPVALAVAGSRALRARHRLAGLRRPADAAVRHLQQRLVFSRQSAPERLLWAATERRLTAGRALRAGLLCFGLPVPGVRPDVTQATVRQRGGLTYVDTPAGRFLLTAGDEVTEDAVDQLVVDGSTAPPAADSGATSRAAAPAADGGAAVDRSPAAGKSAPSAVAPVP